MMMPAMVRNEFAHTHTHFDAMYIMLIGSCMYTHVIEDIKIKMTDVTFKEIVGRGSFSVVHRGTWKGKDVALKCISVPEKLSMGLPQEI